MTGAGGVWREPVAVARWLADCGVEVSPPVQIRRIGIGQSNLTSQVTDTAGRSWVLREPPSGAFGSAHDMAHETRMLDALGGNGLPLPVVVARGSFPYDRTYYAMTRLPGVVLESEEDAQRLSPAERDSIGRSVPEALARLHALDPRTLGLEGLVSRTPYVERQLRRIGQLWDRAGRGSHHDGQWQGLRDRLVARAPDQVEQVVVHGDFRLANLLVQNGGISGILDWELATVGDPLVDLAWLLDDWRGPDDAAISMPSPTRAGGFGDRTQLLEHYVALTGREIDGLDYYRALTKWRAASLLQGVLVRRREGVMGAQGALDLHLLDDTIKHLLGESEHHLERTP